MSAITDEGAGLAAWALLSQVIVVMAKENQIDVGRTIQIIDVTQHGLDKMRAGSSHDPEVWDSADNLLGALQDTLRKQFLR